MYITFNNILDRTIKLKHIDILLVYINNNYTLNKFTL